VLSRMRADAAADAVAELPQRRRQPVLDQLPAGQRTKVLTLLGYNATSAGGLMGMDYIAAPTMATVVQVLEQIRQAGTLQPEALASVHAVDETGCLRGVAHVMSRPEEDFRAARDQPAHGRKAVADRLTLTVSPSRRTEPACANPNEQSSQPAALPRRPRCRGGTTAAAVSQHATRKAALGRERRSRNRRCGH
jgi:hypothetical protein